MKWFGKLLCRIGLHHDGTDVNGGYLTDCTRCGKRIIRGDM